MVKCEEPTYLNFAKYIQIKINKCHAITTFWLENESEDFSGRNQPQ